MNLLNHPLFWKSVHETDSYVYEQHRLLRGRRRAATKGDVSRPPRHKEWLKGGKFGFDIDAMTARKSKTKKTATDQ